MKKEATGQQAGDSQDPNKLFKLNQGDDCGTKSLPLTGRQPTKISQHTKECLTTEEAKVIYDCLNQNQIVSPIQFNIELPQTILN